MLKALRNPSAQRTCASVNTGTAGSGCRGLAYFMEVIIYVRSILSDSCPKQNAGVMERQEDNKLVLYRATSLSCWEDMLLKSGIYVMGNTVNDMIEFVIGKYKLPQEKVHDEIGVFKQFGEKNLVSFG